MCIPPTTYLNLLQQLSKKDLKGGDDDDDEGYNLTPTTENNYRKIDQEYERVMNTGKVRFSVNFSAISMQRLRHSYTPPVLAVFGVTAWNLKCVT